MARPRKQEVDYFPHYCDHGKVLFILESRFGNDGYAVFYKINELLGKTEGHCYNASTIEGWEYLLSKMNTGEEIVLNIIEKLANMCVIDKELWQKKQIWMQSFVDSITDVYVRRKTQLPLKPELMYTETPLDRVNDNENPQSKVKDSKLKDSKTDKPLGVKKFIKPDIQEIQSYCDHRKNNIDPQAFLDHYISNGWMVGKNKMKDWKAAVRTWERNNYNNKSKDPNVESGKYSETTAKNIKGFKNWSPPC